MSRIPCILFLSAFLPLLACSEPEKPAAKPSVRAVVYQLWVVEGAMDMIHGGGRWIREIYLPDAGLCFNVEEDRLNFFASDASRYAAPKPAKEPNAVQDLAAEHPARVLGEIEVDPAFVANLQQLLKQREEARTAAKSLFDAAPALEK